MRAVVSFFAWGSILGLSMLACSAVVSFDEYNSGRDGTRFASTADATASESGGSSGRDGAVDAREGGVTVVEPGVDAAVNMCPQVDATTLAWKVPTAASSSCSEADLTALVAYVDGHGAASIADLKGSVASAACASCIFGNETDATWASILANAAGGFGRTNQGGCIALVTGDVSCGKAYQNTFDCRFGSCGGDPACIAKRTKCECKSLFDLTALVCGAQIGPAETACTGNKYTFEGIIRVQCIASPP
jgi:hypothetical protein